MKNFFTRKNVLITGGLGFIGSNLAHQLISLGSNVTIIDNLNPLYGGNLFNIKEIHSNCKLIINDVRNTEILNPLIKQSDIIYHFAAQVSYIDSLSMPYEDLSLNATSTLAILEACRELNPKPLIVFSSSRMVYGKPDKDIITENSETNPLSLYGIHKLTSEKYLLMYYKDFGIPCIIMRLANPFGPRQQIKHSKYSLIGWFIRQAMEDKTIQIFGEGQQKRDYMFSEDVIEAIIKCSANPESIGEIINIGSGVSTKFHEMVQQVVKTVKRGNLEFVPWPGNYERIETGDIELDISKLKRLALWYPNHSLGEGIALTYEYYKHNMINYL